MLKGISPIISPELLKALCEMGHGDTLVIADGNFPSHSVAPNAKVVRLDGNGAVEVLEAVLQLVPLDQYCSPNIWLMEKPDSDPADVSVWGRFASALEKSGEGNMDSFGFFERFRFYEEASRSYLIIATSETSQYANVMLKKGCLISK